MLQVMKTQEITIEELARMITNGFVENRKHTEAIQQELQGFRQEMGL